MADLLPVPRDNNNTPIYGSTDAISGALTTLDTVHKRVYDGEFFTGGANNPALANDGELDCLLVVTTTAHLRMSTVSDGLTQVWLYEGTTVSAAGAVQTVFNRNRESALVSDAVMTAGPTITDLGTALITSIIPGASGAGPASGAGGAAVSWEEWVLPAGTYLMRMKNISGGAAAMSFIIDFYHDF